MSQKAYRIDHHRNRKSTPSEKFVKFHYPDARCVIVDNTYREKTTRWYVIFIHHGVKIEELGASRKNEMIAWRKSAYWTKRRISKECLKKLES